MNTDKLYIAELPEGFWNVISEYLPNYSIRQDIADNDDVQKYIDNEYDYKDEDDLEKIKWVQENFDNPELEMKIWNRELLVEAMEAAIPKLKEEIKVLEKSR